MLAAAVPEWTADAVLDLQRLYREGKAAIVTDDVQQILGRKPTSYADVLENHKSAFQAQEQEKSRANLSESGPSSAASRFGSDRAASEPPTRPGEKKVSGEVSLARWFRRSHQSTGGHPNTIIKLGSANCNI